MHVDTVLLGEHVTDAQRHASLVPRFPLAPFVHTPLVLSPRDLKIFSFLMESLAEALTNMTAISSPQSTICASDAQSHAPLTNFTVFGKLPTELRLRIWRLAAHRCFVSIVFCRDPGFGQCPETFGVLQACPESRNELRHRYKVFHFHNYADAAHGDPEHEEYTPPWKTFRESAVIINYENDIFGWQWNLLSLRFALSTSHSGIGYRNAKTLKELVQPVKRIAFHVDPRHCFTNRQTAQQLPGVMDWDNIDELQERVSMIAWSLYNWRVLASHLPVLKEVLLVFTESLYGPCLNGPTIKHYRGYTEGKNKVTDFVASKIKERFEKAKQGQYVTTDVALTFIERFETFD